MITININTRMRIIRIDTDAHINNDAEFERKHPRDKDGKFGSGGGQENLGTRYDNLKGQSAINKLMETKEGYVPGAFSRDDIGDIDLIWGNDNMGVQHIIKRRNETEQNLEKVLSNLTNTIEQGILTFNKSTGRLEIKRNDQVAIISPQFHGKDMKFVLTAFEIRKLNGDS